MSNENRSIKNAGQWILAVIILAGGILCSFVCACPSVSPYIFILFAAAALIAAPPSEKILSSVHAILGNSVFRIFLSIVLVVAGVLIIHSNCGEIFYSGYAARVKKTASENSPSELAESKNLSGMHTALENSKTCVTDRIEKGKGKDEAADKDSARYTHQGERKNKSERADSQKSYKSKKADNRQESFNESDTGTKAGDKDHKQRKPGADRTDKSLKKRGPESGKRKELSKRSKRDRDASSRYAKKKEKNAARDKTTDASNRGNHADKKSNSLSGSSAVIAEWTYNKRAASAVKLKRCVRNGKIIFLAKNGDKYQGAVKNGMRNGYGIYTYSHGAVYKGMWKDNMAHGYGTIVWPNGDRYTGYWIRNKRSGKGIYFWKMGDRYTGMWKNDKKTGEGRYIWKRGDVYEGEWYMNLRHGHGIYIWPDGRKYKGRWIRGVRQ